MSDCRVSALGYIELGVNDIDQWQSFAHGVLCTDCVAHDDEMLVRVDDANWRVRLTKSPADDILSAGFEFTDASTLDGVCERLSALGYAVESGTDSHCHDRGVDRLAITHDPFGLTIELYVGTRSASKPCRLPNQHQGFVTGEQGLGHIVITVADQQAAESFYVAGLGLRLSDHIVLGQADQHSNQELQLTFLHCNPRHHTLALVPVPAARRLNHFMLQVKSLDEVGAALDRANAAAVPITSSLGKHTNDKMVSFYMQTPSGFDIEYGFGGVEIDDTTWQPQTYDATSTWGHKRVGH